MLTKGDLLNLHRTLVKGVRGGTRFAGQLRRQEVQVGDVTCGRTVIHHQPLPWAQVEDQLKAVFGWIEVGKRKGNGDDDPWVHSVIHAVCP